MTEILSGPFYNASFDEVIIPATVTKICTSAFRSAFNNYWTAEIHYKGTEAQWNAITIEDYSGIEDLDPANIHFDSDK